MVDRKVLPVGNPLLRKKSKLVKPENIHLQRSQDIVAELLRVMRGPRMLGREKGGAIAAPQIGIPSRLILYEDPPGEVSDLSSEERKLQRREEPFGPKAVFNPRVRKTTNQTAVLWERNPSMPGYRALVERPLSVRVTGLDPEGAEVDYIATGWEARLAQQAADACAGIVFTDRCLTRSLRHLDAQNDPLPPDLPPLGDSGTGTPSGASEKELEEIAGRGGSRGFLAGVPGIGRPNVLLVGSLLLRLRANEVEESEVNSDKVQNVIRELKEAQQSDKHPLGIAAPQLGHRLRAIAVGESEKAIELLTARDRISQEHRQFGPLVLLNPVIKRHARSPDAYFYERSTSIPGYEAVVGRMLEIDVEALDEKGTPLSFTARGWQARMIQHTLDILDGVLYIDRMERRSFRRDIIEEETPEGVPYGLKPLPAAGAKKKGEGRLRIAQKPRRRDIRR